MNRFYFQIICTTFISWFLSKMYLHSEICERFVWKLSLQNSVSWVGEQNYFAGSLVSYDIKRPNWYISITSKFQSALVISRRISQKPGCVFFDSSFFHQIRVFWIVWVIQILVGFWYDNELAQTERDRQRVRLLFESAAADRVAECVAREFPQRKRTLAEMSH